MTRATVYIRGNIDDNDINKIQDLATKDELLSNQVTLVSMGERFDANYVSLGVNILAAIASLLNIILKSRDLFRKRDEPNENTTLMLRLQEKISVSTKESVDVIQLSFPSQESIAVTMYESSLDRIVTVRYSRTEEKDILDIS